MRIKLTKPQFQISQSNKRFRVPISGRRFGKTYLTIIEMMKQASGAGFKKGGKLSFKEILKKKRMRY